jgi:hypothetical protein
MGRHWTWVAWAMVGIFVACMGVGLPCRWPTATFSARPASCWP